MKKDSEIDSSSLEMLLDTMCNTFGGTIFMAISLIVIASMMKKDEQSLEERNLRRAESLAGELRKLVIDEANLASEVSVKEEVIRRMTDDPRRELLVKAAQLEDQVEESRRKMNVARLQNEQARLEADAARGERERQRGEAEERDDRAKKLDQELAEIRSEIESIKKNQERNTKKMVFRKIQKVSSSESPYFIIAKAGKLWRIGPDQVFPTKINSDVSYDTDEVTYSCNPSSSGTLILSGEAVSKEALQLLAGIPLNRYPEFFLYPDCATAFHVLAEALKARSAPYGVSPGPSTMKAVITFVKDAEYER